MQAAVAADNGCVRSFSLLDGVCVAAQIQSGRSEARNRQDSMWRGTYVSRRSYTYEMANTAETITQLVTTLRGLDESGHLAQDSDCWLTFNVSHDEYDRIDGTDEVVDPDAAGKPGFRTKYAYRSSMFVVVELVTTA